LFFDFDGIKADGNEENDVVKNILHKIIYEAVGFRHELEVVFCSPFHGITDIEELKSIFSIEHFSLDEDLRKYLVVSSENLLS